MSATLLVWDHEPKIGHILTQFFGERGYRL